MIKNIEHKYHTIILLMISLGFYIFFFFMDGFIICADSASYIEMHFTREPLYSIYLSFFRFLFNGNEEISLLAAVFGQSILAGIAAFSITHYLSKEFRLPSWISYAILAMPLATSLLCRFAAQRGSMYSNCILTEGITISLYLLFFRYCLEYLLHRTKKGCIWCAVLCFIGISMRKQMYILLLLFFLALIYTIFKNHEYKKIISVVITIVSILLLVSLLDRSYNLIKRNEFTRHVDDNRFVATMVFYTADRDYANYIENEEIRQVFLDVYDVCNENGYLMNSAPSGWFDEVTHFSDHYDLIQLNTLSLTLEDVVPKMDYAKEIQFDSIRIDMVKSEIIRALLPHEIPRILKVMFNNFLAGLVNTIAQRSPILCVYAILAYLAYFILLAVLIIRNRKKDSSHCRGICLFAAFVIISLFANVALVASVIFCQSRYVIYNMAPFYIVMILILYELFNPSATTDKLE